MACGAATERCRAWPLKSTGRPVVHGARIARILSEDFDVIHYHNISLVGGPGIMVHGSGLKIYTAHEHWLVCPTHILWRHQREICTGKECLRCAMHYRRRRSFGAPERCWSVAHGTWTPLRR